MVERAVRHLLWGGIPLATLALACMPVLGPRTMVAVIGIWLALLVGRLFVDPVPIDRTRIRQCLLLAVPFGLMVLDMLRAPDLLIGWKVAERGSSFLLFPLGFLILGAPASGRYRTVMMDLFALTALLLALLANASVLLSGWPGQVDAVHGYAFTYREAFARATRIHPPYAAYFLLLASLFLILRSLDDASHRIGRLAATIPLIATSMLLASRMPLFAFAVTLGLVLLIKLRRRYAIRTLAVAFTLGFVASMTVPGTRERTLEMFKSTTMPTTEAEVNSMNIRGPILACTIELLRTHWLTGTGESRVQDALDGCYARYDLPVLMDGSYGTHDQLLHWWLSFGLAGLLLFVIYFGALLRAAWRARDTAHLALLVFLLLCMTTEDLLTRQWGVVLFAFFNALFIASASTPVAEPATEGP